jgi:hypothetical protein
MVSFIEKLREACAAQAKRGADPLREKVETTVRGMEAISTFALLDLLGLPKTTGNGRRLAKTMRSLGFVPIKSRRLMPGGCRDTVTRGWARPFRGDAPPRIFTPRDSNTPNGLLVFGKQHARAAGLVDMESPSCPATIARHRRE